MLKIFCSALLFCVSTTIVFGQSIRFEQLKLEEAFEESAKAGQPLMVFAYFDWDKNVAEMDSVLLDSTLATISKNNFKAIKLPIQLNDASQRQWLQAQGINQFPAFIFVNGNTKTAFAVNKGQPESLTAVIDGFEAGMKTYYDMFKKDFETALTSKSAIFGYNPTMKNNAKQYNFVRQQAFENSLNTFEVLQDLIEISLTGKGDYHKKGEALANLGKRMIFKNTKTGKTVALELTESTSKGKFNIQLIME